MNEFERKLLQFDLIPGFREVQRLLWALDYGATRLDRGCVRRLVAQNR
jgi:hypothetical protein